MRTASATSRPVRGKQTTRRPPAGDAGIAGVQRELERLRTRRDRAQACSRSATSGSTGMTSETTAAAWVDAYDEAIDTVEDWLAR